MKKYSELSTKEKAQGWAVLIVLGLVLYIWLFTTGGEDKMADVKPSKQDAAVQAHLCANEYLKNPGSANHAYLADDDIEQLNDSTFKILSYVDAQNDFGALKRMYYKCTVVMHGQAQGKCLDMQVEYR